jgi:xanthosine utilization system XapX-like protein
MKTLSRLLLAGLAVTLVVSVVAIHANLTETPAIHGATYTMRAPWLHNVHQISLFGVVIWCLLFVRSEPMFARMGLVALLLSFTVMALPPKVLRDSPALRSWH